jgi:hypothetical protein
LVPILADLYVAPSFPSLMRVNTAPAFRASMLANSAANGYLRRMFESFEFCLPTKSTSVPDGPDWLHEIKYDGYACVDIGEHVGFARCGDEKGRCSVATGFGEAAEALLLKALFSTERTRGHQSFL